MRRSSPWSDGSSRSFARLSNSSKRTTYGPSEANSNSRLRFDAVSPKKLEITDSTRIVTKALDPARWPWPRRCLSCRTLGGRRAARDSAGERPMRRGFPTARTSVNNSLSRVLSRSSSVRSSSLVVRHVQVGQRQSRCRDPSAAREAERLNSGKLTGPGPRRRKPDEAAQISSQGRVPLRLFLFDKCRRCPF